MIIHQFDIHKREGKAPYQSIEFALIFEKSGSEIGAPSRIQYYIYDSSENLLAMASTAGFRIYYKDETLYPKIAASDIPDGIVTVVAFQVGSNYLDSLDWVEPDQTRKYKVYNRLSDFATKTLHLTKAEMAAPEPSPVTVTAPSPVTVTAPSPVTVTAPSLITFPSIPEVSAEMEIIEINKKVTTNMIRQELINFTIVNNRIQGSIRFIATDSFNPYYYNKEITNYLQLKSNDKIIHIKPNRLRFTETERDELINFNEYAFNLDSINAESFVWTGTDLAMSNTLQFTIETGKETQVTTGTTGLMGAGVLGIIGILMLGGFIADHKRGK